MKRLRFWKKVVLRLISIRSRMYSGVSLDVSGRSLSCGFHGENTECYIIWCCGYDETRYRPIVKYPILLFCQFFNQVLFGLAGLKMWLNSKNVLK